jgi:hypothetical protein
MDYNRSLGYNYLPGIVTRSSPLLFTDPFSHIYLLPLMSPGEFGSERLVQRVVDTVLRQTAAPVSKEEVREGAGREGAGPADMDTQDPAWAPDQPSKIILTGQKVRHIPYKEDIA